MYQKGRARDPSSVSSSILCTPPAEPSSKSSFLQSRSLYGCNQRHKWQSEASSIEKLTGCWWSSNSAGNEKESKKNSKPPTPYPPTPELTPLLKKPLKREGHKKADMPSAHLSQLSPSRCYPSPARQTPSPPCPAPGAPGEAPPQPALRPPPDLATAAARQHSRQPR